MHRLKRFPKIPIFAWFLATVVLFVLTGFLLRSNNFEMNMLRERVFLLDSLGDEALAREAVDDLAEFVSMHMNTNVGGEIHLANSFAIVVAQAQEDFYAQDEVASEVYIQAQAECEDPNILLSLRAECVQNFVSERIDVDQGQLETEINFPDPDSYIFSISGPSWTPDRAGILLLVSVAVGAWTAVRVVVRAVYS